MIRVMPNLQDVMPLMNQMKWNGPWHRMFAEGLTDRWNEALQRWLVGQRWYLEKGATSLQLELRDAWSVNIESHVVWWLLVRCTSSTGNCTYHVPLVMVHHLEEIPELLQDPEKVVVELHGRESSWVIDAWHWPPFAAWVVQQMSRASEVPRLNSWHDQPVDLLHQAEVMPASHSNTGIRFGHQYFMKVQRQWVAGLQPDEELGRELSKRGSRLTIPLLAGLHYHHDGESATVATLAPYTVSQGNGWDWLQTQLSQATVKPEQSSTKLMEPIRKLAQRTAELHRLLGQPSTEPAFAPEPFESNDLQTLKQRVLDRWERTTTFLMQNRDVLKHESTLMDDWFALGRWQTRGVGQLLQPCWTQRIHGDYHLGQTLRVAEDWVIMDFEGEPLRPLAERRAKDLPLRDVAGLLRSLDYARAVASQQYPLHQQTLHQLGEQLQAVFLESYIAHSDAATRENIALLLPWYLLEKALYEVEYEVRSRPSWVGIPLRGAIRLIQAMR